MLRLGMKTHKVWEQCGEEATLNGRGQHYLKCTMASYSCNITVSKQLQKVSSTQTVSLGWVSLTHVAPYVLFY